MSWVYNTEDNQLSKERKARLIGFLRRLPGDLKAAVSGLDDAQLDTPYGPGKWTIRQVVHHLADAHCNGFARLRWILVEDKPTLKTYEQEHWAELPDCKAVPVDAPLAILKGLHERIAYLLEGLSDSDWARTAVHPQDGEVTLAMLVGVYSRHGASHIKQITSFREEKGW